jgi:hypothetical protein
MKNVKRDRSVIWRYLAWSAVVGAVLGGISGAFLVALTPKMHEATVEVKTTDSLENTAARFESRMVLLAAVKISESDDYVDDAYLKEMKEMRTIEADPQQQVVRLTVRHASEKKASEWAQNFVKGYDQVIERREKLRAESQQSRWQTLRSQWLEQLEVLEPGQDQQRIDELVRKISLVHEVSTAKAPAFKSDVSLVQAPVVLPVVRTFDHLATMGMGALRGILWCVGLCLLCIAALPSVILPAKSGDEMIDEEKLKGSSWLDAEVLPE